MRKSLLFFWIVFCLGNGILFAQSHKYERSGMTVLYTDYSDQYQDPVRRYFEYYQVSSRYDLNKLPLTRVSVKASRDHATRKGENVSYSTVSHADGILAYLNQSNVGLDLVAKMFNRQPDGTMDISLMEERGLYNATDEDYIQSVATKRGIDRLKDFGENLIAHSYITVIDYQNVRYEYVEGWKSSGDYYWKGHAVGYLYQIDWSLDLLNAVYNCWIMEDDTPEVAAQKRKNFEEIQVPFKLVLSSVASMSVNTEIERKKRANEKVDVARQKQLKQHEMFQEGTEKVFSNFEEQHERFQLKTGVYETHPVRAKIGEKEGLEKDMVFYVYENVAKEDNTITQKRIGVIAVTNEIADNKGVSRGNSELTRFYRMAGGRIEQGQMLTEKKFYRMAIEVGAVTYGDASGFRLGLEADSYAGRFAQLFYALDASIIGSSVNGGLRVGYGFRANNFQLFPYVGANYGALLEDVLFEGEEMIDAWFANVGVKMNINIYFPIWLTVGAGYTLPVLIDPGFEYYGPNLEGIYLTAGLRYYF